MTDGFWPLPNGETQPVPLFELHGMPGGRIACWVDPTIYARHGLRRFTFDRPGYGESTRLAGRSVGRRRVGRRDDRRPSGVG